MNGYTDHFRSEPVARPLPREDMSVGDLLRLIEVGPELGVVFADDELDHLVNLVRYKVGLPDRSEPEIVGYTVDVEDYEGDVE